MQSALEKELTAFWSNLGRTVAAHDPAVVLGLCLCFAPFPPVNLVGLILTGINFALVRAGRLPRTELPLIRAGVVGVCCYAIVWGLIGWWVVRTGVLASLLGWIGHWRLPFWQNVFPPAPAPPVRLIMGNHDV